MYRTILGERAIEDGQKLIEKLEEKKFPIVAALWQYFDEDGLWRLVIVSPLVDQEGQLESYRRVNNATRELGDSVQFGINDVSVIGPSWTRFRDLRRTLENSGVGRVGLPFEDFYPYWWDGHRVMR